MPAPMRFPGSEYLTTSEQFLELDTLLPRLVFVGGGYISFELAHVAARAGARVTILHRGPRPLQGFDPDLVDRHTRAGMAPAAIRTRLPTSRSSSTTSVVGPTKRARPWNRSTPALAQPCSVSSGTGSVNVRLNRMSSSQSIASSRARTPFPARFCTA